MTASPALSTDPFAFRLHAASPAETAAIGTRLALALLPGDVVALRGPLGAGKSHLARAIVRARLGDPQAEVPSPTYTLLNIHGAPGGEIWHADLYRIDPEELAELGLGDIPADAVLLVEWAERWPGLSARRLDIALEPSSENSRDLIVTPHGAGWQRARRALGATR